MLKIGKVVNTHGIKGEVRILSDFDYKDIIFRNGSHIYINNDELIITSYRVHKCYDMVKFEGIDNINDVLKYKGFDVYIKRDDYKFPSVLDAELIGANVYFKNKNIGVLKQIQKGKLQKLMVIYNGEKDILVPYVDEFVKKATANEIELTGIEGLIDAN